MFSACRVSCCCSLKISCILIFSFFAGAITCRENAVFSALLRAAKALLYVRILPKYGKLLRWIFCEVFPLYTRNETQIFCTFVPSRCAAMVGSMAVWYGAALWLVQPFLRTYLCVCRYACVPLRRLPLLVRSASALLPHTHTKPRPYLPCLYTPPAAAARRV